MILKLLISFGAGILTVASPCVLPVLPVLLGASMGVRTPWRAVFIIIGFIGSFSLIATLFTVFTSVAGISRSHVRMFAVVLLLVFGLAMLIPRISEQAGLWLNRPINSVSGFASGFSSSKWGGLVVGASLGVIWTPCVGPVLGFILTLIAASGVKSGFPMLFAFALGTGIPMFLIAWGGSFIVQKIRKFSPYLPTIQRISGILIILVAVAIFFDLDGPVQGLLYQVLPHTAHPENYLNF